MTGAWTEQDDHYYRFDEPFVVLYHHWLRISDPALYSKMPYREYLKTDYWRVVRKALFLERNMVGRKNRPDICIRCEQCGKSRHWNPGTLFDVHHLTYEHRGDEFKFLNDLMVLCRQCHRLAHELPPESERAGEESYPMPSELLLNAGRQNLLNAAPDDQQKGGEL